MNYLLNNKTLGEIKCTTIIMYNNIISYFVFLGDFMLLNYIYAAVIINLLPLNNYLSIDQNCISLNV